MRTAITEVKVYNLNDIEADEDLKKKVIANWHVHTSHIYEEAGDSRVKFLNELPAPPEEEVYGFRLRKFILNNFFDKIQQGKYYSTQGYWDEQKNYHYKYRRSNCQFEISCTFTGVCYDEDLLDPFRDFVKEPNDVDTFDDLVKSAKQSLEMSMENEIEYLGTWEAIAESIEANEHEFTEEGEIF